MQSLAAIIGARNQHAAHGVERSLKKWQIRIAKISGVLLEHRGKKKALEENVRLIGGQVDAVGLSNAAETSFIFAVQMLALGAVCRFVNSGVGKGAGRICAVKKHVKLLPCSKRLPFIE